MKIKYNIGFTFGKNNNLEVIDIIVGKGLRKPYVARCNICYKDPELFGDAIYNVPVEYIHNNKCPCGCSHPKLSKEQWIVIIKRKSIENNHTFIGFSGEFIGQNTKLEIICNVCNNMFNSCSINNYIRDRGCPTCANKIRASKRSTSSEEWISRFVKSGQFPTSTYSFRRISETGRTWEVYCSKCNDKFISDRSNLVAGKVPCNCSSSGGFDVNKPSYFYILEFSIYGEKLIKYGITNFYKRRLVAHKRSLRDLCGIIENFRVFSGDGKLVLSMESEFKRNFLQSSKQANGFRKECCSDYYMDEILTEVSRLELEEIQATY